jgi:hypothetical protein
MWLTEQIGRFPRHLQSVHYNCTSSIHEGSVHIKKGLEVDTIGRGDAYILVFIKSGANFKLLKSLEHLKNLKTARVLYLGLELTVHVFKSKSISWDSPFKRKTLIFL